MTKSNKSNSNGKLNGKANGRNGHALNGAHVNGTRTNGKSNGKAVPFAEDKKSKTVAKKKKPKKVYDEDPKGEAIDDPVRMYLCLLYTSPSPRDATLSRMPSSA